MEFFFSNNIDNDVITLDVFESRHCVKVMRHKIGDTINVVDGLGNLYVGNLIFIDKKSCKMKISFFWTNKKESPKKYTGFKNQEKF